MAKVYAAIEHTDAQGKHEVGDEYDHPRNTDEEKAEYQRKIEYGLISENPVKAPDPSNTSGSSSRRRPQGD